MKSITLPTQIVVSGYWVFAEELTAERLERELDFEDRIDYIIYYDNDQGEVIPIAFMHATDSGHVFMTIKEPENG